MPSRNYPRLGIEEFGAQLLVSGDLDPVYSALYSLRWDGDRLDGDDRPAWSTEQIERFLVAYWCLYHCGAAAHLSELEGGAFWSSLHNAATQKNCPVGERWPRGHERRHFRGKMAAKAVTLLWKKYGQPEDFARYVIPERHVSCAEIMALVQEHFLFGRWIGFKVADMAERVLSARIDFEEAAIFMFDDPTKAATMLFQERTGLKGELKLKPAALHQVVGSLIETFREYKAPPAGDRPVGLQEVETILCKWKSHRNGHYPPFNDIIEIRSGLEDWRTAGRAVEQFLGAMPEGPK